MSFKQSLRLLAQQNLMQKMELLKIKENNNEAEKSLANETFSVDEMTSKEFHNDVGAHIEVIGTTLKNKAYWNIYRDVILYNKHIFHGRTVLNIGCGVGLLSLFAARAGAAQVFAVDNSNATDYAARVVQANHYAHIIKVFKSPLKDLELPVQEVDIILCDWMGYSVLFQSQCADVIFARDKWLKKTSGYIFPDMAKLYVAGLENPQRKAERIDWWYNVHGFNMSAIRAFALKEPYFQQVLPEQIVSSAYKVFTLNLNTATLKDLQFRSKFVLTAYCDAEMDGIFTFFHISFSQAHTATFLHADAISPPTRWLQTVFFFDDPVKMHKGQDFYGGFEMYALREGDLNVMEAGCEMFSGNPDECFQIETEMRWCLKPASMIDTKENTNEELTTVVPTEEIKEIQEIPRNISTIENIENGCVLPAATQIEEKKFYTQNHNHNNHNHQNQYRHAANFNKNKQRKNWQNNNNNNTFVKKPKKKKSNNQQVQETPANRLIRALEQPLVQK